jgi:tryptophan halogenase
MYHNVKSVTIVGGGSSGWMTAAAFTKLMPDVKLTLIESPNVPTIGVGESTIGHINIFFSMLGLKDEDWMKHCNATYKTSIKFVDFRENPTEERHTFHYPFGQFDLTDKPRGVMDWFLYKARHPELDCNNFAEFFHDGILMSDANKMTDNSDFALRGFDFKLDTAYHMDATLFGQYLKDNICIPGGMTHILDDVTGYSKNSNGELDYITTENSGNLKADLFIDCTGFKSLLLEQAMGEEFISFHDTLWSDSAIATVIPYLDIEKEMENYTSCTAIDAGWVWNIPLWNRIGTGYVYSSKFATQEEAEAQFRKHLASNRMTVQDAKRAEEAEVRHIKIKHGVHKHAWVKNVVGIGLANGFIEPLESTGLMLTHECITKLLNVLTMRNGQVTQYEVDMFNYAFQEQIIGFKNFISQHYALSMRNDTPYWQAVTGGTTYDQAMIDQTLAVDNTNQSLAIRLHRQKNFGAEMSGIIYIAAGMGYNPVNVPTLRYDDYRYHEKDGYWEEVYAKWVQHHKEVMPRIDKLPTHYQFLKDRIYS